MVTSRCLVGMEARRASCLCFSLPWACWLQWSWSYLFFSLFRTSRATWRTDRDMGLMNAIGLQPRNPPTSVTSQGTQTLAPQLQNAETQTEREVQEQESASAGTGEGRRSMVSLREPTWWFRNFHVCSTSCQYIWALLLSLQQRFLQPNLPVARCRWSGEWISGHMNRKVVFFTCFEEGKLILLQIIVSL